MGALDIKLFRLFGIAYFRINNVRLHPDFVRMFGYYDKFSKAFTKIRVRIENVQGEKWSEKEDKVAQK